MHVDEFIYTKYQKDSYARWVLLHFRMPAVLKIDFADIIKPHLLFCTYEGERMRCTGASRLGDVWLTYDFSRSTGYDKRVDVADCTEWDKTA